MGSLVVCVSNVSEKKKDMYPCIRSRSKQARKWKSNRCWWSSRSIKTSPFLTFCPRAVSESLSVYLHTSHFTLLSCDDYLFQVTRKNFKEDFKDSSSSMQLQTLQMQTCTVQTGVQRIFCKVLVRCKKERKQGHQQQDDGFIAAFKQNDTKSQYCDKRFWLSQHETRAVVWLSFVSAVESGRFTCRQQTLWTCWKWAKRRGRRATRTDLEVETFPCQPKKFPDAEHIHITYQCLTCSASWILMVGEAPHLHLHARQPFVYC